MIRVAISNDESRLGEAATRADLERYRANLETRLGELFPGTQIYVVTLNSMDRNEVSGEPAELVERIQSELDDMTENDWLDLLNTRDFEIDGVRYRLRATGEHSKISKFDAEGYEFGYGEIYCRFDAPLEEVTRQLELRSEYAD